MVPLHLRLELIQPLEKHSFPQQYIFSMRRRTFFFASMATIMFMSKWFWLLSVMVIQKTIKPSLQPPLFVARMVISQFEAS